MEKPPRGHLGRWAMGDTENRHPRFRTKTSLWLSRWVKSAGVCRHGKWNSLKQLLEYGPSKITSHCCLVTNLCVFQSGSSAFPVELTRVKAPPPPRAPQLPVSFGIPELSPFLPPCYSHIPPVKTAPNRSSLIQSPLNTDPETCNDFGSNPALPKGCGLE